PDPRARLVTEPESVVPAAKDRAPVHPLRAAPPARLPRQILRRADEREVFVEGHAAGEALRRHDSTPAPRARAADHGHLARARWSPTSRNARAPAPARTACRRSQRARSVPPPASVGRGRDPAGACWSA